MKKPLVRTVHIATALLVIALVVESVVAYNALPDMIPDVPSKARNRPMVPKSVGAFAVLPAAWLGLTGYFWGLAERLPRNPQPLSLPEREATAALPSAEREVILAPMCEGSRWVGFGLVTLCYAFQTTMFAIAFGEKVSSIPFIFAALSLLTLLITFITSVRKTQDNLARHQATFD
jgi:hypothetical protein